MRYEIRLGTTIKEHTSANPKWILNEPHWIIYYADDGDYAPETRGFKTYSNAMKYFERIYGTSQGIKRVIIETH
jgi:hypothetical protein